MRERFFKIGEILANLVMFFVIGALCLCLPTTPLRICYGFVAVISLALLKQKRA